MYYGWYLSESEKSENFVQSGIWTHDLRIASRIYIYNDYEACTWNHRRHDKL